MSDSIFDAFFWIEPSRVDPKTAFNNTKVIWHYPEDVSSITKEFRDIPQFCFPAFRSMLLEVHAIALLEQTPGSCRKFLETIYQQSIYQSDTRVGGYVRQLIANHNAVPDLYKDFHLIPPRFGRISNKDVPILPLFEVLGIDRFFKLLSAVMCERRVIFIADEVETLSSSVLAAASMLYPFSWHHIFIPLLPSKLLSYVAAPMPYMMGVRRYLLPELYREALEGVLFVDVDSGEITVHGDVTVKDLVGDSGNALKQATESLDRVRVGMTNMFLGKGHSSGGSSAGNDDSSSQRDLMAMILSELKSLIASKPGSASIQSVASGLLRGLPGQVKSTEEAKAQWILESEKVLRDNLAYFFVYLFSDMDDFVKPTALLLGAQGAAAQRDSKMKSADQFGPGDSRSSFDLKGLAYRRNQMGDSKYLQDFMSEFIHSQMFERFCDEKLTKMRAAKTDNATRTQHSASTASNVSTNSNGSSGGDDADELFDSSCLEIRARNLALTVANAKQIVHTRSAAISAINGDSSVGKVIGSQFHQLTLQYTSSSYTGSKDGGSNATYDSDASSEVNAIDLELNITAGGENAYNKYSSATNTLERICSEAHYSDVFIKIMHTIAFRLESCRVSSCRGSAGTSGVRAMTLLKSLLLSGPHCVLSYALDFVPTIRKLIKIGNHNASKNQSASSGTAQALEFISTGAAVDPRPHAMALISLLFDHNKLIIQQKYEAMRKEGAFQFLNSGASNKNKDLNSRRLGIFGSKQFPSFASLHGTMNSANLPSIALNTVRVTPPELLKKHTAKEEDDDDTNDNAAAEAYRVQAQRGSTNINSAVDDPFSTPFGESFPTASASQSQRSSAPAVATTSGRISNVSPKRMSVNIAAPVVDSQQKVSSVAHKDDLLNYEEISSTAPVVVTPFIASTSQPSPVVETPRYHVVDKSTGEVVGNSDLEQLDTARFRVVNLDTGEVMDIRDIAKLQEQHAKRKQQIAQRAASNNNLKLAPPPTNSNAKPNTTAAAAARRKSTDPFSLSSVKSGFTDMWDSVTTGDPFGFNSPANHTPSRPTSNSNAGFVPTAAAPVTKTSSGGLSPFAPSTSWGAAPSPQQVSRPAAGVYPSSTAMNNGTMGGYGGAPVIAQQPHSMQPPPARNMQINSGPPPNPFMTGGGNRAAPQGGSGEFVPTMQQPQGGYGMQPVMQQQGQPQYQVRQVGQTTGGQQGSTQQTGARGAPPRDPFSDLVNLK